VNEQEIERLVIRLVGDGSSFQQMLGQATEQARTASDQIMSYSKNVEDYARNVGKFTQAAASGLASFGALYYLKQAMNSYVGVERSQVRLTAAIEAGGRSATEVLPKYQALAAQLAENTLITLGQVMSMAQLAETMGVTGSQAETMIKQSVALGAAGVVSAEHALRALIVYSQTGNAHLLRHIQVLRGIHEESQLVAKANQLIASGMKIAEAEANTLGGQFDQLGKEYKQIVLQFGSTVGEVIKPVVTGVREVASWFIGLNQEVKTTVVIVGGLVALFAALPGIIGTAGAIFNTMFGGAGLLLGAVITPIALGLAAWVNKLGGVSAAWERVKDVAATAWEWVKKNIDLINGALWLIFPPLGFLMTMIRLVAENWDDIKKAVSDAWDWAVSKTMDFIDWIKPVFRAAIGVVSAAWDLLKETGAAVWDFIKTAALTTWYAIIGATGRVWDYIKDVWDSMTGGTRLTWNDMRLIAITALIAIEFAFRNVSSVAQWAWAAIRLAAVEAYEDIKYFWSTTFPILVYQSMTGVVNRIAATWAQLGAIIRGEVDLRSIWTGINFALPSRARTELEVSLMKEFAALNETLRGSWEEFYQRRLKEIFGPEVPKQMAAAGKRAGQALGANLTGATKDELKKLDAVLYGSAEAIHRIAEFLEVGRFGKAGAGQIAGATAGLGATPTPPTPPAAPPAPPVPPAPPPLPEPSGETAREIVGIVRDGLLAVWDILAEPPPAPETTPAPSRPPKPEPEVPTLVPGGVAVPGVGTVAIGGDLVTLTSATEGLGDMLSIVNSTEDEIAGVLASFTPVLWSISESTAATAAETEAMSEAEPAPAAAPEVTIESDTSDLRECVDRTNDLLEAILEAVSRTRSAPDVEDLNL
jgi:hypothetical protein